MFAERQTSRALVCVPRGQDSETEVTVARLRSCGFEAGRRAGSNGPQAPVTASATAEPSQTIVFKAQDSASGTLADENYRLGGGDRLRIRFYDRHDRGDLNGDYVIGESGQLRLPRIGEFDARGKTVAGLEGEIRMLARHRGEWLGSFSIEVAQCRPFYVMGAAASPGSYPYVPGYTVLHAVCMAGGLRGGAAGTTAGADREKRILAGTMGRLAELIARRARLEAERNNAESIGLPEELAELEPVRAGELIEVETKLLQDSREAARRERVGLERAIQLSNAEIESHRAAIARAEQRIEEQKAAFERLEALCALGFAGRRPIIDADAALDAAQHRKEEALAGLARAGIELETLRKELSSLALFTGTRTAEEIARTDREIARLKAVAAELAGPAQVPGTLPGQGPAVCYRIMRRNKWGEPFFEQATETTPILPGDVIQIESRSGPASE